MLAFTDIPAAMLSRLCSASCVFQSAFRSSLQCGISGCSLLSTSSQASAPKFPARTLFLCVRWKFAARKDAFNTGKRYFAADPSGSSKANEAKRLRTFVSYTMAGVLFMLGGAYAGVPLYRMICQVCCTKFLGFFQLQCCSPILNI